MWIEDSLAIADAVVIGTPRQSNDDAAVLEIQKTLWGRIDSELKPTTGTASLQPPCRCRVNSTGIWILLRCTKGYGAINPDERPLAPSDWNQFEPALKARTLINVMQQQEGDVRTVQARMRRDGRQVPWVLTISAADDGLVTALSIDGREVLNRGFDEEGRLRSIRRMDAQGDGFELQLSGNRPTAYVWYRAGQREGISREYYTYRPDQLREQVTWHEGVRDGLCRVWDEDGKLTGEVLYEQGFIAPVTRYRGLPTTRPVATLYRTHRGVFYTAHEKIDGLIKVGMNAAQVSNILRVDFSEKSGITFPLYTRTRMLHIAFADGKVASIRTADNSVCFDPPARK